MDAGLEGVNPTLSNIEKLLVYSKNKEGDTRSFAVTRVSFSDLQNVSSDFNKSVQSLKRDRLSLC